MTTARVARIVGAALLAAAPLLARASVDLPGDLNPEVRVEAGRFVVRFDHRVVSPDPVPPERASAGWAPPDWRVQGFEMAFAADGTMLSPRKAISRPRTVPGWPDRSESSCSIVRKAGKLEVALESADRGHPCLLDVSSDGTRRVVELEWGDAPIDWVEFAFETDRDLVVVAHPRLAWLRARGVVNEVHLYRFDRNGGGARTMLALPDVRGMAMGVRHVVSNAVRVGDCLIVAWVGREGVLNVTAWAPKTGRAVTEQDLRKRLCAETCRGIAVGVLGKAALVAYTEMGAIRTAFVERIPALD